MIRAALALAIIALGLELGRLFLPPAAPLPDRAEPAPPAVAVQRDQWVTTPTNAATFICHGIVCGRP